MRHKTKCVLLCQSIAVYLYLAECAVFQTHLLLLVFAFFSSPNSSEVILRVCGASFVAAQTVSHLVSPEVDGDVWRAVCITRSQLLSFFCPVLCHALSLSPPPALLFSASLTHLSFILFLLFIVSSSWLCPSLSFSDVFFSPFLLLGLLLLPHSHYPTLFCSHFIFHLNTFSLYHSHTHASPPQSNQSGSSPPPPPPTYHRVYCICHHVLLA